MSNTTHATVTVEKVNEFTHKTPIVTRVLISSINKVVANGSKAILFTKGLYGAKTLEVSETKAAVDLLINGGFVDGNISLSVTAIDDVVQASTATSFLISSIADYVVNGSGSTLRVQPMPTKKDVFYTVTESVATIDALLPIALVSGAANIDASVTAAGVDNTDATVLTEPTNIIDTGAANTGVILPQVNTGDVYVVINNTASRKLVYPFLLDRIDSLTISTEGYILEPQSSVRFTGGAALTWESDTETLTTDEIFTDTITERTAAAGVTIDGTLLKDGGVSTTDGTLADPAVKIGATEDGLYEVAPGQVGMSIGDDLVGLIDSDGLKMDSVQLRVALGTLGTGVTAKHYSSGKDITTVLTLTGVIVGALDGAAAAKAVGFNIFSFPAGQHFELVYSFADVALACVGTTVTTETGLGSVVASGAVAILSGTPTFEDRVTGQAYDAGVGITPSSALVAATAGIGTGISLNVAASVKDVFLNSAGTWNVDNTGNLTADGTIVLKWTVMD